MINIDSIAMFEKPIPKIGFPSIKEYKILGLEEEIVDLANHNEFVISPKYFDMGITGGLNSCYVRESVLYMLLKASKRLPLGYKFRIYDGWRPYGVQKHLYDMYFSDLKSLPENINCTEDELHKKTGFFVSFPSLDINNPSLHNTGGSVDLTIVDDKGHSLNMGTNFDDFSNKAWTNYYEDKNETNIRDNRRLLYNVMLSVGFTNLPSEWWHYDFGTKFWGYFNNADALYKGVLAMSIKNSFPLM